MSNAEGPTSSGSPQSAPPQDRRVLSDRERRCFVGILWLTSAIGFAIAVSSIVLDAMFATSVRALFAEPTSRSRLLLGVAAVVGATTSAWSAVLLGGRPMTAKGWWPVLAIPIFGTALVAIAAALSGGAAVADLWLRGGPGLQWVVVVIEIGLPLIGFVAAVHVARRYS